MEQVTSLSNKMQNQLVQNELRNKLGQATVKWMKEITKGSNEALGGYQKDNTFLQKKMWYGSDLLEACNKCNQNTMVDFLMKGNKLLSGYAPNKYFSTIPDSVNFTGVRVMHLIAKKDVLPSEALKAAVAGLTICDCGMACQIARYGALLDVLEEGKFNRLFGKEHGQSINLGYNIDDDLQPMRLFVDFTNAAKNALGGEINYRPVEIGQLILIDGVPTYTEKKPLGNWASHNVICYNKTSGEQRFGGFGLKNEGETEAEINQRLLNEYNRDEEPFKIVSSEVKSTLEKVVPQVAKLKDHKAAVVRGYAAASPQDFKIDLISDLVKMPLHEISISYVMNHLSNRLHK